MTAAEPRLSFTKEQFCRAFWEGTGTDPEYDGLVKLHWEKLLKISGWPDGAVVIESAEQLAEALAKVHNDKRPARSHWKREAAAIMDKLKEAQGE